MQTSICFVLVMIVGCALPSRLRGQATQLWESPTISGETGTLYSPADSSYSFAYTIDTVAHEMTLYSTNVFTATYTLSNVRSFEYPAYVLPDMNGNGSPEVLLQYYSLPGYGVSIRDALSGQVLQSWNDATNSYFVWQVFQSTGSRTLKLAMRKTNVTSLAANFIVYSLGVSTGTPSDKNLPAQQRLEQNFPNPFNPSTTIRYEIPSAGFVQLDVYDVAGRRVRTFEGSTQEAGSHQIAWNGFDDRGTPVASGVYFYVLSIDKFIQSKKMILLR